MYSELECSVCRGDKGNRRWKRVTTYNTNNWHALTSMVGVQRPKCVSFIGDICARDRVELQTFPPAKLCFRTARLSRRRNLFAGLADFFVGTFVAKIEKICGSKFEPDMAWHSFYAK